MSVIAFPSVPAYGTDADQPLRVLGPQLSERIARINDVRARLRRAGVRMLAQDLMAPRRPWVQIERGLAFEHSGAVAVRKSGDLITAVIDDVDVCWCEPAQ